jgi:hypothetical protein
MAGDSSLCQGELDETITYAGTNNASAQAILLTFIQVGASAVHAVTGVMAQSRKQLEPTV